MTGHAQKSRRRRDAKVEERPAAHEPIVQTQPMDAVGQLCGGVAHELNNLLSVILGETDLALMFGAVNPQSRESFTAIRKAGNQAAALTRQMLAFSNRQLLQPTVFDLNDLLSDESKKLPELITEDITLLTEASQDEAWVLADRAQIEHVVHSLVSSAREAMTRRGTLTLETGTLILDTGDVHEHPQLLPGAYVVLSVRDTGAGMTDDETAHVFEPFVTSRAPGMGTGLGLAASFEIVKRSGGHITVHSEAAAGTTFMVYLPLVPAPPHYVAAHATQPSTGTESILLTDDDDAVRQVAARILQQQGYRVLQAASAGDALRILSSSEMVVDLLLTDVVLPHMGGRELAERARKARPGIRVLFTSGYTNDVILQHQLIARDVALVQKPFSAESLARKVREVLDTPALVRA